jgi:membrane fusion protein (multidrug efflux system)
MSISKLHVGVAVLGLVVAGSAAWWWQHRGVSPASVASAGPSGTGAPGARGPAGAGGPAAPGGRGPGGPAAVEVASAQAVRLVDEESAVGSLRSRQGVMLRPEVSGRIAAFGFTEGQRVRRGQMLVQLDDTLPRAQLKQAEAQAAIARTQLQRNRDLVAQNFVSQSAVDQSAAALEVAEAQVAVARAQVERMRIVAPFDAVAGLRTVNLGDYVKDGADLVSLEDTSSMWVDFRLPERVLSRLRTGQPVDAEMEALPGRAFKGRIEAVDAQVDANGRSLLVRARLDNGGGVLKPGMFARVRTVFGVREKALVVPEEALVPQGGKQFLILVVDGPEGKVSRRIEARMGLRQPGRVEILEGVRPGDQVVVAGQARLLRGEGLPVKVVEVGRAGQAPGPKASGAGAGPRGAPAAPASGASRAARAPDPSVAVAA